MRVSLLGPVRARVGGRPVNLGARMQRFVLAVLALEVNRLITTERLIDLSWPADPPRTARRIIHGQISRLRATFAAAGAADTATIRGDGPGYVLDCEPDRIDAHRFAALLARARQEGDDRTRIALLDEALALWQGPVLTGTAGEATRILLGGHLEQARLDAAEQRLDALLRRGDHQRVIEEAGRLAGEHPDRHRPIGHLMTALHRAGRTVDALAAYQQAKRRFAEEFGLDPPAALRQIETAILRDDPDTGTTGARPAIPPGYKPAQLPADLPTFTGRAAQLGRLHALLPAVAGAPTTVVCAIDGMGGIGKSALAVHWAHAVADRFPDGQLFVNLRGFGPAGRVMAPAEALRGILDALAVPHDRIPATVDAQSALYRSLLAGKQVLIVLDNARDADQVRPLLPGTPTALTVVTSRNQLTGLLAVDGAHPLTLDLLSPGEARDLLSHRLGGDAVAAEPAAVDEIVATCARLPLALTIAAARARQTSFPLAAVAAELHQARGRLDALDTGDPASEVRAVFSWSYTALTPPAARLFRLLGLHPGADISAPAAAALAGHRPPVTRRLLTELTRANLLTEHTPGRYASHDLLRAYATELTHVHDAARVRRTALTRLLDHYTHTAHAANRLLHPAREPIPLPLPPPAPGVRPEDLTDHEHAMAWLSTEHAVLLAAVRHDADGARFDRHAWQLAWALDTFLHRRGHWHDLAAAWQAALCRAHRLDNPTAQAAAHRRLAYAETQLGRHAEAHTHLQQTLELSTRAGDLAGQARAHRQIAFLWGQQGDAGRALDHAERALAMCRAAADRREQAWALNQVGWYHAQLGDHTRAIARCQQALTLHRRAGDREGQASTWDSLGYAHHHAGDLGRAATCYRHAIALFHDLGNRYNEADTLTHLGDTHHAAGDPVAARTGWTDALHILTDLDHPDARRIRARLGL